MAGSENSVILNNMSNNELLDVFREVNDTHMTFRKKINIPESYTYGNEIEVNSLPLDKAVLITELFNDIQALYDEDRYSVHQEETAAAEIVTPILSDQVWNWANLKEMYEILCDTGATIGQNTSSHIHVGTHMINTPDKLSLLLKTLVVFEPIIFKFGYGIGNKPREFLRYRENRCIFSPMMSPKRVKDFTDVLDSFEKYSSDELVSSYIKFLRNDLRARSVFNFKYFDFNKIIRGDNSLVISKNDHLEVRCFNGTLRPEIVQNNINLITKIVLAVADGKIDKAYVESEYAKYKKKRYDFDVFCAIIHDEDKGLQYNRLLDGFSKIKMEKALRLADMIFDDDLDKCYFLKQYLKLFNKDDEYICGLKK